MLAEDGEQLVLNHPIEGVVEPLVYGGGGEGVVVAQLEDSSTFLSGVVGEAQLLYCSELDLVVDESERFQNVVRCVGLVEVVLVKVGLFCFRG